MVTIMRYWIVYAGLFVAGVIIISFGVAFEHPEFRGARWLCFFLGGLFSLLGAAALLFGDRNEIVPTCEAGEVPLGFAIGLSITLFAGIGVVHILVAYPFDTDDWKGQASWIGWCFFSAALWFALAGTFLMALSRRGARK